MFPEKNFKVNAFLMLADKSRIATVNGLNQLFKIKTDCVIGSKCFACPFHRKTDDSSDKHDGYCECWIEKAGFDPSATTRPVIKEMSGQYIGTKRDDYIKEKKYFIDDDEDPTNDIPYCKHVYNDVVTR